MRPLRPSRKALIERALGAEMSHHLGYPPGAAKPASTTNQRNCKGGKTILTEDGPLRIEVLRDLSVLRDEPCRKISSVKPMTASAPHTAQSDQSPD